jgi:hypothetical protein
LIVHRCVLDATSYWGANCTKPIKNSKIMVREIRGAKIKPKSSFKIRVRKISRGGNYANKYGNINFIPSKNTLHYTLCFKTIYYEVRPESKDTKVLNMYNMINLQSDTMKELPVHNFIFQHSRWHCPNIY